MPLTPQGLDHVVVHCRDVEASAAWYERVLGMRRVPGAHGRVALRFGDQKLNLRPLTADVDAWVTSAVVRAGTLDLCFVVRATVDEVGAHLRACGVDVTQGPVVRTGALGPITSHYCRDPDGNLVEVAVYAPDAPEGTGS